MEGDLARGVSAIILAAGENTRLNGHVSAFMKPLVLVNGMPLVMHALRHAFHDWRAEKIFVVASPHNVEAMEKVTGGTFDARWLIQETPLGVMDAISLALTQVETDMVLILCADNTFDSGNTSPTDLRGFVESQRACVAVRRLPATAAQRFTRIEPAQNGLRIIDASIKTLIPRSYECWIGPLMLRTRGLRIALADKPANVAQMIEWAIEGSGLQCIEMRCNDYGIPAELPKGAHP